MSLYSKTAYEPSLELEDSQYAILSLFPSLVSFKFKGAGLCERISYPKGVEE